MKWERATAVVRFGCLLVGAAGIAAAWRLTWIGAQGIEDIPPPFTLVAGLTGIAFLLVAVIGGYPNPLAKGPAGRHGAD